MCDACAVSTTAILNCQLVAPEGMIVSGGVVVQEGRITAAGRDWLMAVPPDAVVIDAKGGVVGMGHDAEEEKLRPVIVGASADLVCRAKGKPVWVMKEGEIVYPERMAARAAGLWQVRRCHAIQQVMDILSRREAHLRVERVDDPGAGMDLVWYFRTREGAAQRLTIRVVPNLHPVPRHLFILDPTFARQWPEADVTHTRAHWWFYLHSEDGALYCVPTRALKRWLDARASSFPLTEIPAPTDATPPSGRLIPINELQTAIPRLRIIDVTLPKP